MIEAIKNKLIGLEEQIAREKGPFVLFALFLREDETSKWDVLAASDWLEQDKEAGIRYLAENLQKALASEELLSLSRIFVLSKGHPYLNLLLVSLGNQADAEVEQCTFGQFFVKRAYVIRLRCDPAWMPQEAPEDAKQPSRA